MTISINNLTVEFKNGTRALDDVTLQIENGIFGLLGENGAGKTTLMRVLTTLLPHTKGDIKYDNCVLNTQNYLKIQKDIGYLPQELNLYPQLRVREALEYMGRLSGLTKNECQKRIDQYLECTNMAEHQKKRIGQLSGGMRRRVGLIQAMMSDPKVLIVDEPTTGLDPEERIRIRNLLVEFAKDRIVIFSTHVVEDISSTCKNLAIMKKGKVIYFGNVADLFAQTRGHMKLICVKDENELIEYEKNYIVCAKQYVENGISVKIISPNSIIENAENEIITLEDAYMYIMNEHVKNL